MRFPVAVALLAGLLTPVLEAQPKKIVLIAGKKSHGPGAHEYVKSVRLLKVMLDRSPNLEGVRTEIHFNGWPEDPRTLDSADTILTISDGQDGDRYSPVPFMTDERMRVIERQMERGCGFGTLHFSTFTPEKYGPRILEWGGGYFQWQDAAGERNWHSQIKTVEAEVAIAAPEHPVARGLEPFRLREEFYHRIRFREADPRLTPLLRVPVLAESAMENVVAWAVERAGGGRGFGTTMGHAYEHWKHPQFRKFVLNALVWSAGAEVPAGGVESQFYEDAEVDRALVANPVRTLLVTGDNHPSHAWRETTPAIVEALGNRGPEFAVTVTENPEDLANLGGYDLVVLNYANWTSPGLSETARAGFVGYLARGGGLVAIHFANGAFHPSLPEAPPSDWPEYRRIVARVWDAKGGSGHDRYGPFTVQVTGDHPVTRGMPTRFDVVDELYFRQAGDAPVTVLATARSKVTKQDEPVAWVYQYRKARVFQTVLGHSAESLGAWGTMQLLRRGAAWAAGRNP